MPRGRGCHAGDVDHLYVSNMASGEFEIAEASDGECESVRAIGQATTDDTETGDEVELVSVEELREPGDGIREPESQDWDGYRFEPV